MKIRLHTGDDGLTYVRFQAANSEPWYTSEGYSTPANARRSAVAFVQTICTQFGGGQAPEREVIEAAIFQA